MLSYHQCRVKYDLIYYPCKMPLFKTETFHRTNTVFGKLLLAMLRFVNEASNKHIDVISGCTRNPSC